jgi:endonuclease G
MAAPGDIYAFDIETARKAAENFKARTQARESKAEAIDRGEYTKAETPGRVAKRVNRLLDLVKSRIADASAMNPAAAPNAPPVTLSAEMHSFVQQDPVKPEELDDLVVERVMGATRDFLAVGFFERGVAASRAVCRILTKLPDGRRSMGTGFMVTPSLLITNHHVLKSADLAARSTAEFNYQLSGTGATMPVESFGLRPDLFFLNDTELDFALVAVEQRSRNGAALATFGSCPLIGAEGKILVHEAVNIVQHPKGELKQIVIRENTLLDLPEHAPLDRFAHYEADTEPGSSGSPVFNDQWEVIALHHSSVPRTDDAGQILDTKGHPWPPNGDPDEIDWISNEGIRTSRLVAFIKAAAVKEHEKALQAEFIAVSTANLPAPAPVAARPGPVPAGESRVNPAAGAARTPAAAARRPQPVETLGAGPRAAGGSATLTIPLTVTIALGAAEAAPVAGGEAAPTFEAAIQPDPDYSDRPGFDAEFLGFAAPLPTLKPDAPEPALPVEGGGAELKYYHYSLIMNAARKLAFVSAVNFDGGAAFNVHREGGDRWFFDPRIEKDEQTGPKVYANNPLDRGHLTRRADAAWGETEEEAQLANDDTFHWTNCSPQHEVFNQSTKANQRGLLLWGTLENHVAEQAAGGRLSIFNGPIFRKNDRLHRDVKIPREFYKLIVYRKDDGGSGAAAFILSQQALIKNLPAEEFEVGPYQPFQVKIGDLEARTGLDFGTIRGFDALRASGQEAFLEGATASVVPLAALRDVVL